MSSLLSVSELFKQSWAAASARRSLFIKTMGASVVCLAVASGGSILASATSTAALGILGILLAVVGFVGALLTAPAIYRVAFNEPNAMLADMFKQGVRRLLPFIGTTILVELFVMVGFVLLIIPGIILLVSLSFAQLLALRGSGPFEAMKQSRAFVRGRWWAILGRLIVVSIVAQLLYLPATILFSIASNAEFTVGLVTTIIGGVCLLAYVFIVGPWMIMFAKTLLDNAEETAGSSAAAPAAPTPATAA